MPEVWAYEKETPMSTLPTMEGTGEAEFHRPTNDSNGGNNGAADGAATPQAQLSSLFESAPDIMRDDAGLNGDQDRLPQLSWTLFLKGCYNV
jgi:hypothetical protein